MITYDNKQSAFILQAKNSTYIIKVVNGKYLAHAHWGGKIVSPNVDEMIHAQPRSSFSPNQHADEFFSLDELKLEYPAYGNVDLRRPVYQVQTEDGYRISDLSYDSYAIVNGKPGLEGLPAVYAENPDGTMANAADNPDCTEARTLLITLKDEVIGLRVVLSYSVFKDYDAVIRSAKFYNDGEASFRLLRAGSMSLDMDLEGYDVVTLAGAWARERHEIRRPLAKGTVSVESRRGASSHANNPFMALAEHNADEEHGSVYGFSLVYSGNFLAAAETEQFGSTRVFMGINPFDFSWKLEPGEIFTTPEVVMVYSENGFSGMSLTYNRLYRTRLARGKYRDADRPIVINNWEATYFNFDEDKIAAIGEEAAKLGIEMLVLDDGWFGARNDDQRALGDWYVNKDKLPNGLKVLVDRIKASGLKFGLWFEPEMISPDSDLYRAHPDWCLHVPGRPRSRGRNQLILDLGRKDVRDNIVQQLTDVLSSADISYVKWDMNRNMSEIGSAVLPADRQMEAAHRYMLGLYEVMETLVTRFPDVLFESCSGGGGRFDPGILYYMPQNWTSDDTDGAERLKIQAGTSLVYPASAMTAHVSAVPNHQTGRVTPLDFRANVAMFGNFGYELDVTKMTDDEKVTVAKQVSLYKEIRHLVQFGDLYRLLSPFATGKKGVGGDSGALSRDTAWITVSPDKTEAIACFYRILGEPNAQGKRVRLRGLDPDRMYRLIPDTLSPLKGTGMTHMGVDEQEMISRRGNRIAEGSDAHTRIYSGRQLMEFGLQLGKDLPLNYDFESKMFRFIAQ